MYTKSLVVALALTALLATATSAQTVGIGTSNPGSISHSVASAIAKLITKETGMQTRVQPYGGSAAFVPAVNTGETDFANPNELDMKFALTGTGIYEGQVLKNLRVVSVLMPFRNAFWVAKDSPIKSIKDLKGKRVPSRFVAQKILSLITTGVLANAGLTYSDVKEVPVPNVNRGADDFMQGRADTFFFAVGSAKVREAGAKVGGLRALPTDPSPEAMARLRKHVPVAYAFLLEPSEMNYGILEPTYVTSMDSLLITNTNVPEDVVYKVTKALYGGKKDLFASFKPLGANFSPQRMAKILVAGEYHPGAIKFYNEVGMWPPKD